MGLEFAFFLPFFIFFISTFFLIKSADYFVDSAEKIGLHFKLPYFFIGVVIIGLGTSLPELLTSLFSVFKGLNQIPFANVIGSNISNLLLIIGIIAIIKPLIIRKKLINIELPFLMLSSLLPFLFALNLIITYFEALILLISLLFYLIYISRQNYKDLEYKKTNWPLEFTKLIMSLIILSLSSNYVINSLSQISKLLSLNIEILSAVLLALATSLPELVTTLSIVRLSKNHDLIIGNILGSNILNVFLILGLSALINNLYLSKELLYSAFYLFLITLIFIFSSIDNKIKREEAYILIILYVIYIVYLLKPSLF